MYPEDLKYSQTHEWIKVDKDIATVGITDFPTKQLTDLAYLELPSALKEAPHNLSIGRLDEVKAARELRLRWEEKKSGD